MDSNPTPTFPSPSTRAQENKFPGLPHIEPDPRIQVRGWSPKQLKESLKHHPMKSGINTFAAQVRRAFIQQLIANHPIYGVDEIREAVRRRFGALPDTRMVANDLTIVGVARVPVPGIGTRLRLASQFGQVRVEDELDERIRIDALEVSRQGDTLFIEMNRGTAVALVQLLNLVYDQGNRPGVRAITTDSDKWVVVHMRDGNFAVSWEDWLKNKLY